MEINVAAAAHDTKYVRKFGLVQFEKSENVSILPSLASLTFLALPVRCEIMRMRSFSFSSCCRFTSSAALRRSNCCKGRKGSFGKQIKQQMSSDRSVGSPKSTYTKSLLALRSHETLLLGGLHLSLETLTDLELLPLALLKLGLGIVRLCFCSWIKV